MAGLRRGTCRRRRRRRRCRRRRRDQRRLLFPSLEGQERDRNEAAAVPIIIVFHPSSFPAFFALFEKEGNDFTAGGGFASTQRTERHSTILQNIRPCMIIRRHEGLCYRFVTESQNVSDVSAIYFCSASLFLGSLHRAAAAAAAAAAATGIGGGARPPKATVGASSLVLCFGKSSFVTDALSLRCCRQRRSLSFSFSLLH